MTALEAATRSYWQCSQALHIKDISDADVRWFAARLAIIGGVATPRLRAVCWSALDSLQRACARDVPSNYQPPEIA